jgi:hypothetical protein
MIIKKRFKRHIYDIELIVNKLNEGKSWAQVGKEIGIKNRSVFKKKIDRMLENNIISHTPGVWILNKKGGD